ncbi:hypothetical protein BDB01DRAFT_295801 [Pilobolus umbonatus]|nr:hypothetical protein BDB01DRAFT_295801 [Pilobolus umbonatus]
MDTRKENVWVNPIELDDRDVQNELGQQSSQIIEPMESLTLREPVGVLRAEDPLKHEQLSDIPEEPESMVPRRYTDRRDSSYQKLFGQTKSDKWTHQSPTNKKDDLYGDSNRRIHYQPDERTPFEEWMHSRGQDYTGDATIESHGTTENHETRRRESSQAAEKLKTLASNAGAIGAAAIGSLFGLGGEQDSRFSKPVPPLNQHHKSSHFDGDYNMPSPGRGISLRDEESSPDKSTSQDDRGISLDNSRDESSPGIVDYVDSQRSTGIDNTWSLNDPSDEGTQPISDHSDQWDESQQSRNLHSNNNTGYNLASDPLRDNETLVTSHDKYADAAYQAVHGTTQRPLDIHKALPRQLDSRQDESRQGDSRQAEKGNKVLHEPNAIDVTHPGSDEKEAQIVDYDPIPQYYDAMPISDSMDKPNKVTGIQGNWFDQTSGDQEPGYRTNPNTRTNKLPRCEDVKEPEMHGQNPSFYSNPNHGSDRFRNLLDENNQPPHKEDTLKSIVAGAGAGAAAAVATVGSLLGINHSGREHDHEQQGDEQRQGYGQQQGHGQQQGLGNGDSMFQKSRLAPHNFDTGVLAPERGGSKDLMYDVLTPNRGKMDDALTSDSSVSPPVVRRDVDAQKQAIQEQRGDEHRPFVHRDVDAQKQAIQDQRGDDQRRQVQRDSAQRLHDQRDNDQRHQDQRDDAQRLHDQRSDAQRHQDQRDDAQRLHDQRSDAQKLHDQRGDAQRQAFHDQRSDVQRQAFQDQRSDVQRQALRDQRGGVQNHQNPPFTQAYVDHPNENKSHEHYEQPEESKQRQRDQVPVQSQRKFSNRLGNNDLETSRQQMYRQQQQQQAAQEMKPMSIDHHPTEGPKMRNFATNTPATTASAHPASYLPGTQTEVFHPMQHPDFDRVDPDIDTHREEKDKRFYGFTHAATSIGTDPFSKGVHYSEILPSDEYPTRRRSSLEHHVTDIFGMHSGPVAGGHHKDHSQGNRFSGYHEGLNQGNRFGDHNEDYNQGNRFGDHNEDYNQGNRFGDHNQDHSHGKFTDKLFGGHKEDQTKES